MSVKSIPLYTPLLYSKNGICRGIPIFLIFEPKHMENIQCFSAENFQILQQKNSLDIAWASFRNVLQVVFNEYKTQYPSSF